MERYCQKGPESLRTSRRNGPLTEKDGKVSARHVTSNRETAAKGEKCEKLGYNEHQDADIHLLGET